MAISTSSTTQTSAAMTSRARRTSRKWSRYNPLTLYTFLLPWLLGFLGLTVIPLIYALLVSFTNFDGISPRWKWVGIKNYLEAIHDPLTFSTMMRTFLYTGISVPLSVAGGLGLAILINRRFRAVGLFRTIFYLPSVVPVVASALMWKLIFSRDSGVVNAVIEFFHGTPVIWLIDPTAFLVLIIMVLWGLGGGMIISLAGLQSVPSELLEAAAVDGANQFSVFFRIILPMMSPILFFQIVTGVVYALQTLIQPILLSASNNGAVNGGNAPSLPVGNQLFMIHVYDQYLYYQRYGYGSALLWILFTIILCLTLVIFRSSALWVYYEIDQDKGA